MNARRVLAPRARILCGMLTRPLQLLALAIAGAAHAQALPPIPADVRVLLRLEEPVSSETHQAGQRFALSVAEDVALDGHVIIPQGARGEGEVVHARPANRQGTPGELVLAARYLRVGDGDVQLRSMEAVGSGEYKGPSTLFIPWIVTTVGGHGGPITVDAGTVVAARTAGAALPPAEPRFGTVYFYRLKNFAGSRRDWAVYEQGKVVQTLKNASYVATRVPVGTHYYGTNKNNADLLTLEVEEGDTYHVIVGSFLDEWGNTRVNLSPTTKQAFEEARGKLTDLAAASAAGK